VVEAEVAVVLVVAVGPVVNPEMLLAKIGTLIFVILMKESRQTENLAVT
jgi:hypothetical protein